ncbi:MAG: HD domain-containing phosphohydrolase [Akkermansiaceae bacterium]|jgi:putative two-component system response regulator|nr:HD domain-containing protein [Luteolibacter sp.]
MTELYKIRVLSLEDVPSDVELQQDALRCCNIALDWKTVENKRDFEASLADFQPDVILSDFNLPNYDGEAALNFVQTHYPHIPMIIVTGTLGELKAVQLIKDGATDYILKDRLARLPDAVMNAVENARLATEHRESNIKLAESERKLKKSLIDFVGSLASIVGLRDPYTAGHQCRVAELVVAMAKEMGLSEFQIEGIHLASMIHDIGKIQVPAEILSKPGRLSDLEYQIVKQHVIAGYEIMKDCEFPWPIAQMILQHHERLDGSGYPYGLTGDKIILEARILSVADVVEAISSHRPYRPALGIDVALKEITCGRGVTYCPQAVDACIASFRERDFKFSA